jgi:2-dehydropantoate 2-reductase
MASPIEEEAMRFIVHGAGAVGSFVGGKLAERGEEVVLIAREAHADAIKQRGLLIKTPQGETLVRNLQAVTHPSQLTPRADDVIFLTVKSAQSEDSAHILRDTFSETTPVICLQNGVRNEEYAARRFLHVYGAMAGLCVTMPQPGEVAATMGLTISLGAYPLGCDELARTVAAKLDKAGFNVTANENIMAVKWSKLILNLNNAALTIINKHLQLATVTPAISSFLAEVMEEGLHVLEAAGISVEDPHNPFNLRAIISQYRSVADEPDKIHAAQTMPEELRTYASTRADLMCKRGETESGYLNGEVILLGEKYNVPTPYNTTLLNVVEAMALERSAPGKYTLEELAGLVEQRRLAIYHS